MFAATDMELLARAAAGMQQGSPINRENWQRRASSSSSASLLPTMQMPISPPRIGNTIRTVGVQSPTRYEAPPSLPSQRPTMLHVSSSSDGGITSDKDRLHLVVQDIINSDPYHRPIRSASNSGGKERADGTIGRRYSYWKCINKDQGCPYKLSFSTIDAAASLWKLNTTSSNISHDENCFMLYQDLKGTLTKECKKLPRGGPAQTKLVSKSVRCSPSSPHCLPSVY